MKRDPSLHITKSNLIKILDKLFEHAPHTAEKFAEDIFEHAAPYQLRDRYLKVLEQNAKIREKIKKSNKADSSVKISEVELFNRVLYTVRTSMNPNTVARVIRQDSKDYLLLKEITAQAVNFCETFKIPGREDGFKEYVQIGVKMMRKYALNKFKYHDSKIYDYFNSKIAFYTDDKKEETETFRLIWIQSMRHYSGLHDYTLPADDFDKIHQIILGRQEADDHGSDYAGWVIAQFEGISFMNALPELGNLYGEFAIKNYMKYLLNNKKDEGEQSGSITNEFVH